MKTWLRRIFDRSKKPPGHPAPDHFTEFKPIPTYRLSPGRWIATALDRAMVQDQWGQARRLVQTAGRLIETFPHVAEQVARYHLALGDPVQSLHVIDDSHVQTASLRMLRNVCLIVVGREREARTDLMQWVKRSTAPLCARTLHALLETGDGNYDEARTGLRRNLRHLEDPASLASIITLCIADDRQRQADHWADRFRKTMAGVPDSERYDLMLKSLHLAQPALKHLNNPRHVQTLALELLGHEDIIPVLVSAQTIEFDPRTSRLLANAIERALPDLDKPQAGHEALARLAMCADDLNLARHWIERGCEAHPMSAGLARLRAQLDHEIKPGTAPQAKDVIATLGLNHEARTRGEAA